MMLKGIYEGVLEVWLFFLAFYIHLAVDGFIRKKAEAILGLLLLLPVIIIWSITLIALYIYIVLRGG